MFRSITNNVSKNLSGGGELTGDVTITGDLSVTGSSSITVNEVIEGTSIIDVDNTEALLVRKNGDAGDVFIVDTSNSRVGIGVTPTVALHVSGDIQLDDSAPFLIFKETGNNKDMQFKLQTDGRMSLLNDNAATEVLTVLQDGSLGIGEDSPDKELHLKGNEPTFRIEQSADANKYFDLQVNTGGGIGKLKFGSEAQSNTLVLGNNNRVSIAGAALSEALNVTGNLKVVSDANNYLSLDSTQTNGDEWQIINANSGATSTLQFKNVDQSKILMLMEETGKVGVAHTAPATTMHIVTTDGITVSDTATDNTNPTTADGTTDKHLTILRSAILSHAPTNANANLTIGMKGGTSTAGNLKFQTGNTASDRMVIDREGTVNQQGNYTVNEQGRQNHVANTMSSPYYRFDGTDDIITITDNDNLTFTDGFTFSAWVYIEEKAYFPILTKGRFNVNWEYTFRTSDAGKLELYIGNGSTGFYQVLGTTVLTEYKWNHVVVTYNGDSTASNSSFGFYLNGVSDAISYNAGSLSGGIPNAGDNVIIGNYDSQYAEGQIASVQMHNHVLDATEIKELYSGASVPFKYKGANQTEIITNGTFGADSDWTKGTGWSIGSEVATKTNTGSSTHLQQSVSMVKGKTYRISYECTAFTSGQLDLAFNSGGVFPTDDVSGAGTTLTSATIKTIKHTASASYSNVRIYGNDAFAGSVDNVSIVQVGAVAEFDGSSAGAKVWGDKSGNGLHGTITAGATAPTLENTPYDSGTEYEEGTWTPTIVSSGNVTFTAGGGNIGQYVRIGNQVTLNGFVIVNGLNSADATQTITLQGLPYGGRTGTRAAVAFGNNEGMAMTRGDNIQGIIYETNTVINLYVGDTTTNNATNMLGSEWSDDGRTYFTVTYFTD